MEEKRVENRLWRKSEFLWPKKNISCMVASSNQWCGRWLGQPYWRATPQRLSVRVKSWKCLSWHATRQGQLQQTLRGEHSDVALLQGPPPDGVHCWGWKDQEAERMYHIIWYNIIWCHMYFKILWHHKQMYDIIFDIKYDIKYLWYHSIDYDIMYKIISMISYI